MKDMQDEVLSNLGIMADMKAVQMPEDLKKKELIQMIADKTGQKKSEVKQVAEAMLDILGDQLAAGRPLNLQPLGKVQVLNEKLQPNAHIIKCKLRRTIANDAETVASANADPAASPAPAPQRKRTTLAPAVAKPNKTSLAPKPKKTSLAAPAKGA